MRQKASWTTWTLAALALSAMALVMLILAPGPSLAAGCGPCRGFVQTVTGQGTGASCSEALNAARTDAYRRAWSNAPGCTPCALQDGHSACALPSCVGSVCSEAFASWTLHYQCRSCSLPGLF